MCRGERLCQGCAFLRCNVSPVDVMENVGFYFWGGIGGLFWGGGGRGTKRGKICTVFLSLLPPDQLLNFSLAEPCSPSVAGFRPQNSSWMSSPVCTYGHAWGKAFPHGRRFWGGEGGILLSGSEGDGEAGGGGLEQGDTSLGSVRRSQHVGRIKPKAFRHGAPLGPK